MALNSDFKVKDSLFVGNSACFTTQTDTQRILSAGTDLWDIFLQEDEVSVSCALTNGDGIATLSYNGSADTTIAVDSAVIDGIAEGTAQGQVAVTNIGNTTTQVDVNGLQTDDSPTFGGLALNGALTTSSTVDGRDIAADAAQLAVLQGLSAQNFVGGSSSAQGTVTLTKADAGTVDIDTGLQAGDSPSFTGLTITSVPTGTSNTVLVSDSGVVTSDEIDSRVWGTSLVDGSGTANTVALFTDGDTVGDSVITQDANGIQVAGGLNATSLSGDGSCITNVVATEVVFPTTSKTDLASTDQFYINDGANKQVTYGNLLTDLAGTGITVESTDSLTINGAAALTNCTVPMWDSGSNCFLDSNLSQSSTGTVTVNGGLTVMDNLSVLGTFTCIDTSVSVTSALSVINTGTGPALYTEQTGSSQPIAKFIDTEGGQIVFGDTGSVGIGTSTDVPSEKLEVVGNIAVTGTVDGVDVSVRDAQLAVLQGLSAGNIAGASSPSQGTVRVTAAGGNNTDVDTGLQADDSPTFVAASFTGLPTATDNTVVVMDGNTVSTDEIDAKVWDDALVDGEGTQDKLPKYTNGTGTIGDSAITDSGTLVTIASDTKIDSNKALQVFATGGAVYSEAKTFTGTVGTTATTVATFAKTNLKSAKFEVTLIKGVNITAFEVLAVYNGTAASGTTYAIVDAQAASQLADVTISTTSTTIDLDITAASATTTAVIKGTANY